MTSGATLHTCAVVSMSLSCIPTDYEYIKYRFIELNQTCVTEDVDVEVDYDDLNPLCTARAIYKYSCPGKTG